MINLKKFFLIGVSAVAISACEAPGIPRSQCIEGWEHISGRLTSDPTYLIYYADIVLFGDIGTPYEYTQQDTQELYISRSRRERILLYLNVLVDDLMGELPDRILFQAAYSHHYEGILKLEFENSPPKQCLLDSFNAKSCLSHLEKNENMITLNQYINEANQSYADGALPGCRLYNAKYPLEGVL